MKMATLAWCVISTCFVLGTTYSSAPSLPKQTAVQAEVLAQATARARADSAAGISELMTMFQSPLLAEVLTEFDDGSNLQALSAEELFTRIKAELDVAELVHAFGLHDDGNCGLDVTLDTGRNEPYFFNQWMLQSLGYVPVDGANNIFTEASETRFFHYPPYQNVSNPDFNTSASRPVYSALNMYRGSGGNPQCGPVSAVFSRKYVGNNAIVAPVDTGLFIGVCGDGQTSGWLGFKCHSWPTSNGTLGVLDTMAHLLPVFLTYYNTTEAVTEQYPIYNLGRLLTRLLSRKTYTQPSLGMSLNFIENTWGYLEANPVVTMTYPSSIKMMIGAYDRWFGTDEGAQLREWCIAQDWPLAWAHNPVDASWVCSPDPTQGCVTPPLYSLSHGIEPANIRILDPYVLSSTTAGRNATRDRDFLSASAIFNQSWRSANSTIARNASVPERRLQADVLWAHMMTDSSQGVVLLQSTLAVEPLYAGACSNSECAAVRIKDGACVCAES